MISEKDLREEYATALEAAQITGLNDSRIRQICIEGKFAGAFKIGDTWLIPRKSVSRYMPGKRGRKPKTPRNKTDREILEQAIQEAANLKNGTDNG